MNYKLQFPGSYQFRQMLDHLPEMVFWKNIDNIFFGCNQKFADFIGLASPDEIIGKNGYDFFEPELVRLVRSYDEKVKKTKQPVSIEAEIEHPKTGRTMLYGRIVPIFDEAGNIESLLAYGTPIAFLSNKPWTEALKLINAATIHYIVRANKYPITTSHGIVKLSKRETECALLLIKGHTSREIAEQLHLAPKTVGNYLDNLKNKLDAFSKSELITLLIESDFLENF